MIPQIRNQKSETPALHPQRGASVRNSLWLMIAVLLIAALFRFAFIDSAPPGWRDDELIEFGMDQRIVQGWRPLFISEAEGHEPVYHYIHAGTLVLFGENIIGYKWLPFAFGLLAVALTFALARRMFDARVGLLAAALMAVSFWPIMYSRLGIRHIGLLPWMLGAFYLLYPRASGRSLLRSILAGICLAAGLMTYFAGRAVPIILIGFLIYLLLFNRSILRRVWKPIGAAIALGALIALPMFIQIAQTPGGEKRTEVVGGPLIELTKGNFKPALDTTLGTLGMFTFVGDPESLYNVSGRPVFDWLTGLFFYLGVLISLIRLKRVENGFALAWLVIGIAPAFVSLPAGSFSHTIAAQPIVFVLTAVGVVEVSSLIGRLIARKREGEKAGISLSRYLAIPLSLILVAIGSWLTIRDYFGTWAHDDFVRFQYHAPTRDIAKWLDQNPDVVDVAIGTNPNELYLDPVALKLDLKRQDVKARWFDPETAVIWPGYGYVVSSAMGATGITGHTFLSLLEQSHLDPRLVTQGTSFGVYAVNGPTTVYPFNGNHADFTKLFGDWIVFEGLASGTPASIQTVQAGDQFVESLQWYIGNPSLGFHLKSFAHILDSSNRVVAGDDLENINVLSVQAGDYLIQKLQFKLPDDLRLGQYWLEVGWYNPDTGERLKLPNGDDRLLIQQIEVTAP